MSRGSVPRKMYTPTTIIGAAALEATKKEENRDPRLPESFKDVMQKERLQEGALSHLGICFLPLSGSVIVQHEASIFSLGRNSRAFFTSGTG